MKHTLKKCLFLVLAAAMLLSVAACGQNSSGSQPSGGGSSSSTPSSAPSSNPSKEPTAATVDWPTQNITVICPSSAGGGTDITIRAFTDTWAKAIGKNVVVTNYDSTPVGMQACVDSAPTGYTVVCHQNTAICQYVTGVLDVSPIKDLELVAALQYMGEQALIVPADAPFNDFTQFIDYAKAHPGEVSVAIATGGPAQFLWGSVMLKYDVDLKMVVAANTTDKLTNIAGGFIDCGQVDTKNAQDYEEAGKVKVIGTLSTTGVDLPTWPSHWHTLQNQGYDVGWDMRLYMWTAAGTPEEVLQAMNQSLKSVMEDQGVIDTLKNTGAQAEWFNLEESRAILKNEYDGILASGKALGIAAVEG